METLEEELVIARTFDAPISTVFRYWTDSESLKKWWGPRGFVCTVSQIDPYMGGHYLNSMQGPDGNVFWSTGTYLEIDSPRKIVCTDSFSDEKGNIVPAINMGLTGDWPLEMLITVIFEDNDGKTKMFLTHTGVPPEIIADCKISWNESFDKLSEALLK